MISNTKAAVAAYAEAVSDGVADKLRRRLFYVIWVQGRHVSSAHEVRRVITGGSGHSPDRAPVGRLERGRGQQLFP